eukprot:c37740_g1_i1 orf=1-198(+)
MVYSSNNQLQAGDMVPRYNTIGYKVNFILDGITQHALYFNHNKKKMCEDWHDHGIETATTHPSMK